MTPRLGVKGGLSTGSGLSLLSGEGVSVSLFFDALYSHYQYSLLQSGGGGGGGTFPGRGAVPRDAESHV